MTWQRVASRQNVDITTSAAIEKCFYQLAEQFSKRSDEMLFVHIKDKGFTRYFDIDFERLGRFVYATYFDSPEKIKKYETDGKILLKEIKKNH